MVSSVVRPTIEVHQDFDNYFHLLVKGWIDSKVASGEPFHHQHVIITAGPYRTDAVATRSTNGILTLDFYSALRNGFGSLSEVDITTLVEML